MLVVFLLILVVEWVCLCLLFVSVFEFGLGLDLETLFGSLRVSDFFSDWGDWGGDLLFDLLLWETIRLGFVGSLTISLGDGGLGWFLK